MRNGDIYCVACTFEKGITMEQNKKLKRNAQHLRKNATREEGLLWHQFLRRYPVQFRRQYIIGNYIVDFYCHKAKLVVELDGSQHCEPHQIQYDRERTDYLQSLGLAVLRLSNLDVMRRLDDVCNAVDLAVKQRIGIT